MKSEIRNRKFPVAPTPHPASPAPPPGNPLIAQALAITRLAKHSALEPRPGPPLAIPLHVRLTPCHSNSFDPPGSSGRPSLSVQRINEARFGPGRFEPLGPPLRPPLADHPHPPAVGWAERCPPCACPVESHASEGPPDQSPRLSELYTVESRPAIVVHDQVIVVRPFLPPLTGTLLDVLA